MRASNYYRMAVFYAAYTDPRHGKLWSRSKECFHSMIGLMERPIECVAIPFEGAELPGYFIPAGDGKQPTLIALGGFDSTMEEVYCWLGSVAAEYGWNCLIFEGPGQWGALMNNPGLHFQPDYEKPVGAVVDYLLARSDVDEDRLALIGYSMGGYLAPRGALDQRIKACIANTLVADCGASAKASMKGPMKNPRFMETAFRLMMKVSTPARWSFQHSQWTLGIHSVREWVKAYEHFTIRGLEKNYKNPMMFFFSEDDIVDAAAPSPTIVEGLLDFMLALDCKRFIRLFTREEGASSHCQMGGLPYAHASIFQWLNHVLCGAPLEAGNDPKAAALFVDLFGKHGGKGAAEKAARLLKIARIV
jgi:pimeloyl-ACP methyl ester carboxylesterase